ncbi:MAG: class I SAM-dependent methyltransferase [Candidatus Promineifilaceae bacterium]
MAQSIWYKLILFAFRRLYNELAWTYDAVSWVVSWGDWRAWQRAALPFLAGRTVLEIAHGPGHLLVDVHAAAYQPIGLDLSPAMGRIAQRNMRRAGVSIPLARGNVLALPFAAARFDNVLSTFPTEFIADRRTLQEVWRVLRPRGQFIIVPEGHLTGRGPLFWLIKLLWRVTIQGQPDEKMWQPFITRLEQVGFSVIIHPIPLRSSGTTVLIATKNDR